MCNGRQRSVLKSDFFFDTTDVNRWSDTVRLPLFPNTTVALCPLPYACNNRSVGAVQPCAGGQCGPACLSCSAGYFAAGAFCKACPASQAEYVAPFVCGCIVLGLLLFYSLWFIWSPAVVSQAAPHAAFCALAAASMCLAAWAEATRFFMHYSLSTDTDFVWQALFHPIYGIGLLSSCRGRDAAQHDTCSASAHRHPAAVEAEASLLLLVSLAGSLAVAVLAREVRNCVHTKSCTMRGGMRVMGAALLRFCTGVVHFGGPFMVGCVMRWLPCVAMPDGSRALRLDPTSACDERVRMATPALVLLVVCIVAMPLAPCILHQAGDVHFFTLGLRRSSTLPEEAQAYNEAIRRVDRLLAARSLRPRSVRHSMEHATLQFVRWCLQPSPAPRSPVISCCRSSARASMASKRLRGLLPVSYRYVMVALLCCFPLASQMTTALFETFTVSVADVLVDPTSLVWLAPFRQAQLLLLISFFWMAAFIVLRPHVYKFVAAVEFVTILFASVLSATALCAMRFAMDAASTTGMPPDIMTAQRWMTSLVALRAIPPIFIFICVVAVVAQLLWIRTLRASG
ncbi:MAG: hypothetical protein EOO65_02525 [Methanosarcinales archaeon]|nr:MAG: hypothetical protein EOO65_02525 [Methanosarcinales archaeon]